MDMISNAADAPAGLATLAGGLDVVRVVAPRTRARQERPIATQGIVEQGSLQDEGNTA